MSPLLPLRWRMRATAAAVVLPPLVHLTSLERLNGWLVGSGPCEVDDTVDDVVLASWVDRVLNRLPPPWRRTCLKRALVMHYLLHRAGRDAELKVGVRREHDGKLAAHAWLIRHGVPYLESPNTQIANFEVIASLTGFARADP